MIQSAPNALVFSTDQNGSTLPAFSTIQVMPSAPSASSLQTSYQLDKSSFSNAKIKRFMIQMHNQIDGTGDKTMYATGTTLAATVILDLRKKIKALKIVFDCICEAKLGIGSKKRIFHQKKVLYSKDKGAFTGILPEGCHTYPVEMDLLANLLPSFQSGAKFISYFCKAKIIRYRKKNCILTPPIPFEVYQRNLAVTDLLYNEPLPVDDAIDMDSCTVECALSRTAFSISDEIVVDLDIKNNSSSKAKLWISTCIVQKIRISSNLNKLIARDTKEEELSATQHIDVTIMSKGGDKRSIVNSIKNLQPSADCPELSISYLLRVKILRERTLRIGRAKPKHMDIPIVIGLPRPAASTPVCHIPVHQSYSRASLGTLNMQLRSEFASSRHGECSPKGVENMAPPAYSAMYH